jgi:predicted dehydrogenase
MTGSLPSALPAPRTPDPMDAPPLRWGVLGTGWIAQRFTAALHAWTRQRVYAVGSRSVATARRFADSIGAAGAQAAYGSYAELVADPAVDVVYVATPHNFHHPHARLALEAGKHVVVEKPMGLDAGECRDLAALAAARGRFCMEATWTLFLPKFDVIRQLLEDGVLGEVHAVLADMGEHFGPEHRIMRADLAGGPLLDLGTYPATLATWVLGAPAEVTALGSPAPSGVNGQIGAVLRTARGQLGVLHTTLHGNTPTTAAISGSRATLAIDGPFYQPGGFTVTATDGSSLRHDEPAVAHAALHFEAAEVARCIAAGMSESPLRPLADTVATLEVMDAIRHQVGIVYAGGASPDR